MSKIKVEVVQIENITNHPNADRLDLGQVFGYTVVVGRDEYTSGDMVVYFPVDSLIPALLQDHIFAGTRMSLHNDRLRAAKIRGVVSQGLVVSISSIKHYLCEQHPKKQKKFTIPVGADLTYDLEVTKYEPPVKGNTTRNCNQVAKRYSHPDFKKYTDMGHLLKYYKRFETCDMALVLLEKVHGTNFRCGWVPFKPRTTKQKLLQFLTDWTFWNFVPEYEFVYGSHNVQLQDGNPKPGAPAHNNVYQRAVKMFSLKDTIPYGEVWYFEIFGPGIQWNYQYSIPEGDLGIIVIDIQEVCDGSYYPYSMVKVFADEAYLNTAPELWAGYWPGLEQLQEIVNTTCPSQIDGNTTPIEGGVLRPQNFDHDKTGQRLIMKLLNEDYLLNKDNTDNH